MPGICLLLSRNVISNEVFRVLSVGDGVFGVTQCVAWSRLCLMALFEPSLLFAELSALWRNATGGRFFSLAVRVTC